LVRLFILTLAVAVGLVALYLAARRLSGALVAPLDFSPALTMGLLIALGTWSLRRLAVRIMPERAQLLVGITGVTWLLVVCLTLQGTSPLAVLALWLPVIATEAYWRAVPLAASGGATELGGGGEEDRAANVVVQQLTRTRADGYERVGGSVQIAFAAGEQTTAQHVAFCPPLESDPDVEIEDAEQNGVTIRATDCRSYGLRLEARRGRDTAEPLTVLVKFEAVAT
jgi:hypothetical protein